jgi:hypothetical protein
VAGFAPRAFVVERTPCPLNGPWAGALTSTPVHARPKFSRVAVRRAEPRATARIPAWDGLSWVRRASRRPSPADRRGTVRQAERTPLGQRSQRTCDRSRTPRCDRTSVESRYADRREGMFEGSRRFLDPPSASMGALPYSPRQGSDGYCRHRVAPTTTCTACEQLAAGGAAFLAHDELLTGVGHELSTQAARMEGRTERRRALPRSVRRRFGDHIGPLWIRAPWARRSSLKTAHPASTAGQVDRGQSASVSSHARRDTARRRRRNRDRCQHGE